METWAWILIGLGGIALAVEGAYLSGVFSTDTAEIDKQIASIQEDRRAFTGDSPYLGGRRKKTKKSKSKHKKTKRRG